MEGLPDLHSVWCFFPKVVSTSPKTCEIQVLHFISFESLKKPHNAAFVSWRATRLRKSSAADQQACLIADADCWWWDASDTRSRLRDEPPRLERQSLVEMALLWFCCSKKITHTQSWKEEETSPKNVSFCTINSSGTREQRNEEGQRENVFVVVYVYAHFEFTHTHVRTRGPLTGDIQWTLGRVGLDSAEFDLELILSIKFDQRRP